VLWLSFLAIAVHSGAAAAKAAHLS
jgi:hypothetical protein